MKADTNEVLSHIEYWREKMHILAVDYGIEDCRVLYASQKLDELLNHYHSISGIKK